MRIEYYPETDSLYIELTDRPGADTRELGEGLVLDVDEHGRAVGLDIDQASRHLDLRTLNLRRLPCAVEQTA
ncbi:MAG: DUF2283 domain-containing protein [Limisphaerales bacterium]